MTHRTDIPPDVTRPGASVVILFTWRAPEGRAGDVADVVGTT